MPWVKPTTSTTMELSVTCKRPIVERERESVGSGVADRRAKCGFFIPSTLLSSSVHPVMEISEACMHMERLVCFPPPRSTRSSIKG